MNVAGAKRVVVGESLTGRGAGILARDDDCLIDNVFRAVRAVSVPFPMKLTLAHIGKLRQTLSKNPTSRFYVK